jgi:hypothetical protein
MKACLKGQSVQGLDYLGRVGNPSGCPHLRVDADDACNRSPNTLVAGRQLHQLALSAGEKTGRIFEQVKRILSSNFPQGLLV